jgi:hypothetical protein
MYSKLILILVKNKFWVSRKNIVKPVYSGHLGEIDKMTTIYRLGKVVGLWARRRALVVLR